MFRVRNILIPIGLLLSLAACSPAGGGSADTTAPTVSLVASSSNVTAAGSITLTATASDNVGVTKVEFYDGATKLGEDISAPYTQTLSYTAANNGSKSYTAKAYDAANYSQTSNAASVTVAIPTGPADTTPPTLVSTTALSNTRVQMLFSEAIVGGNVLANFTITTDLTDSLGISAASVSGDGKTVTLTTAPQTKNQAYIALVKNITDLTGNRIGGMGQNCTSGSFCASFTGIGP